MAKLKNAPVMLVIMDGWGNGDAAATDNAVAVGKTPIIDGLMKSCPVTELLCSGEASRPYEYRRGTRRLSGAYAHYPRDSRRFVLQE